MTRDVMHEDGCLAAKRVISSACPCCRACLRLNEVQLSRSHTALRCEARQADPFAGGLRVGRS